MIIPDANVLVQAYNKDSRHHRVIKGWWEKMLSQSRPVGLPWASMLGFIRIVTNPRVSAHPMPVGEAGRHVKSWLAAPRSEILTPGDQHAENSVWTSGELGCRGQPDYRRPPCSPGHRI